MSATIYSRIIALYDALPAEKKAMIILLRNKNVIRWLTGDPEFLKPDNPVVGYKTKTITEETGYIFKNGPKKGKMKTKKIRIDDTTKPKYLYNQMQLTEIAKVKEDKWSMELYREKRPELCKPSRIRRQKSMFGKLGRRDCQRILYPHGRICDRCPSKEK